MKPYPNWTSPRQYAQERDGRSYDRADHSNVHATLPNISNLMLEDYFIWERRGDMPRALWCLYTACLIDAWGDQS